MHEVSIAQALNETAARAAAAYGLSRVRRMNVELSADAGLAPDALLFALTLVGRGTPAEGAVVLFSGPGAAAEGPDDEHPHEHTPEEIAGSLDTAVRLVWIDGE